MILYGSLRLCAILNKSVQHCAILNGSVRFCANLRIGLGKLGKLNEMGEFYEFRNFMNTWSQQELHEFSVNRLYECKPVKILPAYRTPNLLGL